MWGDKHSNTMLIYPVVIIQMKLFEDVASPTSLVVRLFRPQHTHNPSGHVAMAVVGDLHTRLDGLEPAAVDRMRAYIEAGCPALPAAQAGARKKRAKPYDRVRDGRTPQNKFVCLAV
jgi:hypothetical protein